MDSITENPLRMKITIEQNYARYFEHTNVKKSTNKREYSLCFRYTRIVEEFLSGLEELTLYDESKENINVSN